MPFRVIYFRGLKRLAGQDGEPWSDLRRAGLHLVHREGPRPLCPGGQASPEGVLRKQKWWVLFYLKNLQSALSCQSAMFWHSSLHKSQALLDLRVVVAALVVCNWSLATNLWQNCPVFKHFAFSLKKIQQLLKGWSAAIFMFTSDWAKLDQKFTLHRSKVYLNSFFLKSLY